jgi:hypothetical protein
MSSGWVSPSGLRLIHVLRDLGRPAACLFDGKAGHLCYLLPPIRRTNDARSWIELDQISARPATDVKERDIKARDTIAGLQRILIGMFKKLVLADSLALIALSPQNAGQTTSPLWMWVFLLSYTFRIYFDFSGYTDIAIGLGRLMGFHLPENFDRPYPSSFTPSGTAHDPGAMVRTFVSLARNLRTRSPVTCLMIIFCQSVRWR